MEQGNTPIAVISTRIIQRNWTEEDSERRSKIMEKINGRSKPRDSKGRCWFYPDP